MGQMGSVHPALNIPFSHSVFQITPGKKSPTVASLKDGGFAVSALVLKKDSALVMDKLHELGATDILVFNISNSRM